MHHIHFAGNQLFRQEISLRIFQDIIDRPKAVQGGTVPRAKAREYL